MRLTSTLQAIGKWSKQYANFPDRYIKRASEQVYWRNPKGSQYRPGAVVQRKKYNYGLDRPWSAQFQEKNAPGRYHPKVFVEPIKEWSFFRGDRVEVLVGPDKGKQGIVKLIVEERNWVIVEGLNTKLKRLAKDSGTPGVYICDEQPLLVTTQVALVDPSDFERTAIEWRYTEDGQKVRVSKRTGRIIPIPGTSEETIDYKSPATYLEQPKDTTGPDAIEITFEPKVATFEMDVMQAMGIKEDRQPLKTYWY